MIVFSDLHLRKESRDVVFGEVLPGIKQAAIDDAAALTKTLGHPTKPAILMLGDILHLRYAVDIDLLNQFHDVMLDWARSDIESIFIPGNHDQVDVAGRHAFEVFEHVPGLTVIHQPRWTPIGLFVPYRLRIEDLRAAIAQPKPHPNMLDVAYMHVGIRGAQRNNGSINDTGLHADELKQFKLVLSGHYHRSQKIGHCHYIGSPYETRADEGGQPHGYVRFNPLDCSMAYHAMQWGPRHHHISLAGGINTMDLKGVSARDRVVIDVKNPEVALDQVAAVLQKIGITAVVRPDYPEESTLRLGPQTTLRDYAFAYADKFAAETGGLDAGVLKRVFDEVTKL